MYRGVGVYDMIYDKFEQLCWNSWEEEYIHLSLTDKKLKACFVFVKKTKINILNALPRRNVFKGEIISNHVKDCNCCFHLKTEKIRNNPKSYHHYKI